MRMLSLRGLFCVSFTVALLSAASPPPVIRVAVDARDAPRNVFHARLTIPVKPGPLTLYYPEWIPGEHGPTGPIVNLTGLEISAAGRSIPWKRDLVQMYTFHCDVPQGASSLDVSLDFLSPLGAPGFSSGGSTTDKLAVVSWNQVVLYPEGWPARELTYQASLTLPPGWKYATALPLQSESGGTVQFAPVTLNTLVDSPVLSGAYFRAIPLTPGQNPAHEIDLAADSAAALDMPAATIADYRQLIAETGALFGARHYRDYHFLVSLSNHVAHFGLEHHQSSDDRMGERSVVDEPLRRMTAGLLPHEFVHSWNGKYRRPADLATPDYQTPMKTDLLWVYEGLTTYLGNVLTARSGLWTPDEYRDAIAVSAAELGHEPGREWRSLEDTAVAAQLLYEAPPTWYSWRRGVDFYNEAELIWLEADTIIRRETLGKRSLDNFCRAFYGGQSGPPALVTYTFDDLARALNAVAPFDWNGFFDTRLDHAGRPVPLGGLEQGGWKLVYTEKPNEFLRGHDHVGGMEDLVFSIGLRLGRDGEVIDAIRGLPAQQAGLAPGMKLSAVNGRQWSVQAMRDALRAAKDSTAPIELLASDDGYYHTYKVEYHGGERYPHLERNSNPDLLSEILKPLVETPPATSARAQRSRSVTRSVSAYNAR